MLENAELILMYSQFFFDLSRVFQLRLIVSSCTLELSMQLKCHFVAISACVCLSLYLCARVCVWLYGNNNCLFDFVKFSILAAQFLFRFLGKQNLKGGFCVFGFRFRSDFGLNNIFAGSFSFYRRFKNKMANLNFGQISPHFIINNSVWMNAKL